MSKEQILEDLANAVINCKADLAKTAAEAALAEGVSPRSEERRVGKECRL